MLSRITRVAIRRVAGTAYPSTNRVLQSVWHLQNLNTHENTEKALSSTQFSCISRRSLATAANITSTSAKPKSKKAPAKKAVKKPAKKKAAVKPKVKAKPKKKVVTPEQKEKVKIKELKAVALSTPKTKPSTAWTVLLAEFITANAAPGKQAVSFSREAAAKYKALSPGELEVYNRKANENKEANEATIKQWIKSHTPEQIRLANNARQHLKKLTGRSHGPPLHDDRIPKRIRSGHVIFTQDRWASGDFKGVKVSDAAKLLWKEFLELPESERQRYNERAESDRQRYIQEYKTAFHRDPEFLHKSAP